MTTPTESPYQSIFKERKRQTDKWGIQHHSWGWWSAILGEEYGEVCQEMIRNGLDGKHNLSDLREELVQLAAVAVQIIEHIDTIEYLDREAKNLVMSPSFENKESKT